MTRSKTAKGTEFEVPPPHVIVAMNEAVHDVYQCRHGDTGSDCSDAVRNMLCVLADLGYDVGRTLPQVTSNVAPTGRGTKADIDIHHEDLEV